MRTEKFLISPSLYEEKNYASRQLAFRPVSHIILVTPQNFQIPPPIFHYNLTHAQAPKTQIAKLSIIIN